MCAPTTYVSLYKLTNVDLLATLPRLVWKIGGRLT